MKKILVLIILIFVAGCDIPTMTPADSRAMEEALRESSDRQRQFRLEQRLQEMEWKLEDLSSPRYNPLGQPYDLW